jgi:hypothetical protein
MFKFSNAISGAWLTALILVSACSERAGNEAKTQPNIEQTQPKPSVEIIKWGPQSTVVGAGFAVQSDGNSAIWFEQKGIDSADGIKVFFNDAQLTDIAITPNAGGSAEVPMALLQEEGKFPIYIILKSGKRVDLGAFAIIAKPL